MKKHFELDIFDLNDQLEKWIIKMKKVGFSENMIIQSLLMILDLKRLDNK